MKVRISKIVVIACCLLGNVQAISQNSIKNYPVIGQPLPEFELQQVKYYPKKVFNPRDYKGKWLVMDFWSKGCVSCVKSFPKINELQSIFKDQVQFILVANNTVKGNGDIEKVYDKYRANMELQLPAAFDSALCKQFGIQFVPYIIIVDPEQKVYALTSSITKEKIQDLIDNKKPIFKRASNMIDGSAPTDYWKYLINEKEGVPKDILYRSVLSVFKPGTAVQGSFQIDNNVKDGYYQVAGVSLSMLYNTAYWGTAGSWTANSSSSFYKENALEPILEIKDSSFFRQDYSGATFGYYNYNLIVPREKSSKEYLMQLMQRDLRNYFGYSVSVEKRMMPYWRLTAKPGTIEKLKRRPIWYRELPDGEEIPEDPIGIHGKTTLENMLFSIKIYSKNMGRLSFINETGNNEPLYISIDAVLTDTKEVAKALAKQGLILEKSEKEMNVLVIKDAH